GYAMRARPRDREATGIRVPESGARLRAESHRPAPANVTELEQVPVVFVHGLGGERYDTWGHFPRFLYEDLPGVDVGMYAYRTALKRLRYTKSIALEEEADIFGGELRVLPYERIVLIGHSLGGVVVRTVVARFALT